MRTSTRAFAVAVRAASLACPAGLTVIRADGAGSLRLTTQPGHRGLDWASDVTASP
jgi:hypothetical protein